MQSKLILRTTSGEVHEYTFDLTKSVSNFLYAVRHKFNFSSNTKIIHQTRCLNDEPSKKY